MDDQRRSDLWRTLASAPAPSVIAHVEKIGSLAAAAVWKVVTALMPLAQAFHEYLNRPDVQARIHKAALILREAHDRIDAVEAPGYAPYFERLGHPRLSARFYVVLIRKQADRVYQQSQDKRVALVALHGLAKPSQWHPALVPQIDRLRDHCWEADFLDAAFEAAGCAECKSEFLDLLRNTPGGDVLHYPRLLELITRIAPYAPSARGRPLSFDSALHQTFLRLGAHLGGRQGYTYGLVDGDDGIEDFIDEATAATRIELGRPAFNPIAARRAVKSRLARDLQAMPAEKTG